MGLNLASLLDWAADARPDAPALRVAGVPGSAITYGELDGRVAAFAGGLRAAGVGPGDRVCLMAPNVPDFVVAYWATLRLGAVVVPVNPLLKTREVAYVLRDAGARAFAFWHGMAEHARAGAEQAGVEVVVELGGEAPALDGPAVGAAVLREPQDPAVLLYTSGTTGEPKGATLTHSNMVWNAHLSATDLVGSRADDRVVATLPLFHSFGQTVGMNAAFHAGAELLLVPRFEPGPVAQLIEDERATVFLGVPTMYTALLHAPAAQGRDLSSLRRCLSGGAAMPMELLRAFEEAHGCELIEGYGLSETSPVAAANRPGARRPGSIGRPIWGVEMRVVDAEGRPAPQGEVGEVQIRGHNVMTGYHGRPEATADAIDADGWFSTGDLGRVDVDGFFFLVDRAKDLILRGGLNVYPREVEEVLHEHPSVLECAVVGVPHPELGEEVAAAVVVKPGEAFDGPALREFVRERIAAYKYPRTVVQLEALPKGPTGKVLKREIDVQALVPEATA
ncbi:long-chain fatty acid--CoA ligase [Conexibacter sp. SYSU D00693]|uniref:long-chain-fatty-acid--CoA ligase n=1 Tax=Conexibacter sp. SYSU D00693 TaxID=2812560 RepID=UPI00196A91EF|nr:long-chain fatty acid--CoA ligase [Conexibacter sp. SYSU D00693]